MTPTEEEGRNPVHGSSANCIFVCYAEDDAKYASSIAEMLSSEGYGTWLASRDAHPDEYADAVIAEALEWCPHMLVLMSPASMSSSRVTDQWSYALRQGKTVIPVIREECEFPFRLERLHMVDLREESGLLRLVVNLGSAGVSKDQRLARLNTLLKSADTHRDAGRFDDALADLEEATAIHSRYALLNKVEVLCELERWQEALAVCDSLQGDGPSLQAAQILRGRVLLLMGDAGAFTALNETLIALNETLIALNEALRLSPEDVLSHELRGLALFQLREFKAAVAAFNEAIALDPENSLTYARDTRGRALIELEEFEAAIAAFDEAIALDAEDSLLHDHKAIALSKQGKTEEALASNAEAIRLDPDNVDFYRNRCIVLLFEGDVPDVSTRVLQLDPGHAQDALDASSRAIELDPGHEQDYISQAMAFASMGRFNEALVASDHAMSLGDGADEEDSVFDLELREYILRKLGSP